MFGYIPNIVSFFDFEGLICVFREVYFRFKGLIRHPPEVYFRFKGLVSKYTRRKNGGMTLA